MATRKKAGSKRAAAKKKGSTTASAKSKPSGQGSADITPSDDFDVAFLESQRELLLEERESYLRSARRLTDEAEQLAADREPGDVQFDEESGEGDTISVERERDLALSAQARETIEEIDDALARMAAGTYGICEVSGEPIPRERLEAIPYARVRVEYKAARLGS